MESFTEASIQQTGHVALRSPSFSALAFSVPSDIFAKRKKIEISGCYKRLCSKIFEVIVTSKINNKVRIYTPNFIVGRL
jgi:hypothetical protein